MSEGWSMKADHEDWAREVLADPKTVVLDTETTGLKGYVCEIAILDGKGKYRQSDKGGAGMSRIDPSTPAWMLDVADNVMGDLYSRLAEGMLEPG